MSESVMNEFQKNHTNMLRVHLWYVEGHRPWRKESRLSGMFDNQKDNNYFQSTIQSQNITIVTGRTTQIRYNLTEGSIGLMRRNSDCGHNNWHAWENNF